MSEPLFNGVKAVYFDLDDTLCAYWEASKFALHRAFEQAGPDGYTPIEMIYHWAAAFRGFSPEIKGSKWYPIYLKRGAPTRIEQMRLALLEVGIVDQPRAERLADIYARERDQALKLFEDAEEVLRALKSKFKLGLITNGPADVQRQEVLTLGIEKYFDVILIEGEMMEGKPKPSVMRRAEREVDALGSEILFVGNSYSHDVRPAIEAGWRSIWVRRPTDVAPSSSHPERKPDGAPEPDATINNLRELLPMLGL